MMERLLVVACYAMLFLATASALEDSVAEKMQQHIDRLDAKIAQMEEKCKIREAELITKIDKLETRVSRLEEENAVLTKTKDIFQEKTRTQKQFLRKWKSVWKTTPGNADHAINTTERKAASKIRLRSVEPRDLVEQKPKRALDGTLNIAFSAYIDHNEDGLGTKEKLVFNQILLNDGSGYNKYTGVFTVPTSGVYSFTYFIGQRDNNQLYTGLYVNDVNKVDAVVQTDGVAEDAQGGNSVLLKVAAGDVVYVRKMTIGSHVEGSRYRFTTFSGFLVYPTEDSSSIVGK